MQRHQRITERREKLRQLEKHHIIPISKGGRDVEDNIAYVRKIDHRLYHVLFGNRTPEEIVLYLNSYFWRPKDI